MRDANLGADHGNDFPPGSFFHNCTVLEQNSRCHQAHTPDRISAKSFSSNRFLVPSLQSLSPWKLFKFLCEGSNISHFLFYSVIMGHQFGMCPRKMYVSQSNLQTFSRVMSIIRYFEGKHYPFYVVKYCKQWKMLFSHDSDKVPLNLRTFLCTKKSGV